jgi:FkbM family methyltransferase
MLEEARNADALGRAVDGLCARFAQGALRPDDIVTLGELPQAMQDRRWIAHDYANKARREADAVVFARFTRDMGTILDCGAHWGYTALAIRMFGTDCPIVSIEASSTNAACLAELRQLDGNYDFVIAALGVEPARRDLYCPVVNGFALTGLNCIDGQPFNAWHRALIVSLLGGAIPEAEVYRCQLLREVVETLRLDDLLAAGRFRLPVNPVAAIKLDVDGSEPAALRGATRTLERDRPFIMIEEGNRNPEVAGLLVGLGYVYAERDGERLRRTDAFSNVVNGYWLHPHHLQRYIAMGLL